MLVEIKQTMAEKVMEYYNEGGSCRMLRQELGMSIGDARKMYCDPSAKKRRSLKGCTQIDGCCVICWGELKVNGRVPPCVIEGEDVKEVSCEVAQRYLESL